MCVQSDGALCGTSAKYSCKFFFFNINRGAISTEAESLLNQAQEEKPCFLHF